MTGNKQGGLMIAPAHNLERVFKTQHRGGNPGRAQWEPELRKWTWGSGKSMPATVYRAEYQRGER